MENNREEKEQKDLVGVRVLRKNRNKNKSNTTFHNIQKKKNNKKKSLSSQEE